MATKGKGAMTGASPETKRKQRKTKPPMEIPNAIGFAKHIIGMCVDEEPHLKIRKELWELVEMLYEIQERKDQ